MSEPRRWTRATTRKNVAREMAQMEDDEWAVSLQVGGWWRIAHELQPAPVRMLTPEEIAQEYNQ